MNRTNLASIINLQMEGSSGKPGPSGGTFKTLLRCYDANVCRYQIFDPKSRGYHNLRIVDLGMYYITYVWTDVFINFG